MTQVPILAEGDASSALTWADVVANAVNRALLGGNEGLIELSTTAANASQNGEMRWSPVHQALMRWTGTQWIFAGGPPTYFEKYDFGQAQAAADLIGPFTVVAGSLLSAVPVVPHYTIATHATSAVANTAQTIRSPNIAYLPGGQAGLRFRAVMAFKLAASTVVSRVGFHDGTTSTLPVDGAWLDVVNGVASFRTSQASTVSTHGNTVALVADRWYTIHIWFVTATSVRCLMVRDDGTIDMDNTLATNVPGSAQFFAASALQYNTAAAAVTAHTFDWMGYGFQAV